MSTRYSRAIVDDELHGCRIVIDSAEAAGGVNVLADRLARLLERSLDAGPVERPASKELAPDDPHAGLAVGRQTRGRTVRRIVAKARGACPAGRRPGRG